MKRSLLIVLCIAAALFALSGCTSQQRTILPFNNDIFILTPSDFEGRTFVLRFRETTVCEHFGTRYHVEHEVFTSLFRSAPNFINLMNDFSPVFVSSTTTTRASTPPFAGVTFDNLLYSFMIDNVPNWMCVLEMDEFSSFHLRMRVFEADEYGLLYFYMFGFAPDRHTIFPLTSNMAHYSLYRITLGELHAFIEFVESLQVDRSWEWHEHYFW